VWYQKGNSTYEGILAIWIDGIRLWAYDDPKPLPGGTIAIEAVLGESSGNQSIMHFDDSNVFKLTAPFVPMPTPEPQICDVLLLDIQIPDSQ
jgi:hypothetical protein